WRTPTTTSPWTRSELSTILCRGTDMVCIPMPRICTHFPVLDCTENGKTPSATNVSVAPVSRKILTGVLSALPTSETTPSVLNGPYPSPTCPSVDSETHCPSPEGPDIHLHTLFKTDAPGLHTPPLLPSPICESSALCPLYPRAVGTLSSSGHSSNNNDIFRRPTHSDLKASV